jgi:hypothetical protein
MPVHIFFCYAREDEPLLKQLKSHLIPLERQGLIDFWYDRDINAGAEWESEISKHLNSAQFILLLVSPDFMASDYINNVELKRAIERHEQKEARVIPIIFRWAIWKETPIGKLHALPKDGKPVKSWPDLDEALNDVAEGIRRVVEEWTKAEVRRDRTKKVIEALENPRWRRRTIAGLSQETKLSAQEVQEIISELGGQVRESGRWVELNRPG